MSFDFSKYMKNPKEQYSNNNEEIPEIAEPTKDKNMVRTIAYLTKTRKLSMEILDPLIKEGKLEQTVYQGISKKNGKPFSMSYATFKIYDDKDRLVCLEKINPLEKMNLGTEIKDRKDKKIEGNSSHFGFEVVRGKGENVMFFESTIDMLSYMELFNQSLDNHRLVSMMGCKPSIIKETVKRNNIDEGKIYICSDADHRGDELYNDVKTTFPDAKRIRCRGEYCDKRHEIETIKRQVVDHHGNATIKEEKVDTGRIAHYKDWNDMLKDFKENGLAIRIDNKGNSSIVRLRPQPNQQQVVFQQPQQLYPQRINKQDLQRPIAPNKLVTFGNKYWNDATDKNDKLTLSIPSRVYDSIDKSLRESCINFYGYRREHDSGCTIAINSKDLEWFKTIAQISNPNFNLEEVTIAKPTKNTVISDTIRPTNSRITELSREHTKGFTLHIDTSLKIAELCTKNNVDFLLKINPSQNNSQLRVKAEDAQKVRDIYHQMEKDRSHYGYGCSNEHSQSQQTKESVPEKQEKEVETDMEMA
jgi:hypothetical protein